MREVYRWVPIGVLALIACTDDALAPKPLRLAASSAALSTTTGDCPACVFGPRTYVRRKAAPVTEVVTFSGDPAADYVIDIEDQGSKGADGSVVLNGAVLLAPRSDSEDGPRHVQLSVSLMEGNLLEVRLTGKPGSKLVVQVLGGAKLLNDSGGVVRSVDGKMTVTFLAGALAGATLVMITPSADLFPLVSWNTVSGPYAVSVSGATLALPATVRIVGPVSSLPTPEVWVRRSGTWSFLPAKSQTATSIEVAVSGFSTFALVQSQALAQATNSNLSIASDFVSDGTYGIGNYPPPGLNGWIASSHVNLAGGTMRVDGGRAGCPVAPWTQADCNGLRGAGGAIRSKATFGYGRFNALVRFDVAPGTRYAFYLYNGATGTNLVCNDEATIEVDNKSGTWYLQLTTYRLKSLTTPLDCTGTNVEQTFNSGPIPLSSGFNPAALHTLTIDRQQTQIATYLDGQLMVGASAKLPTGNMHMMFNAWAPGEFRGPNPAAPAVYQVVSTWIGSSSNPTPSLPPGLVAFYALDGNGNDGSAYGNHGTLTGVSSASGHTGVTGTALLFSGANAVVTVPSNPQIAGLKGEMTLVFWLKRGATNITGAMLPVSRREFGNRIHFIAYTQPGGVGFQCCSSGGSDWGTFFTPAGNGLATINDGSWHQIAFTHRFGAGGFTALFLDGASVAGSYLFGSAGSPAPDIVADLLIGRQASSSPGQFAGFLDNVYLFNTILTPSQVAQLP